MKRYVFIFAVCLGLGCEKDNGIKGIAQYRWPLESATISPAITVDGKKETDFMHKSSASACLAYDYTLNFEADSSWSFTSRGPLCDMISFQNAVFTQTGNRLVLNDGMHHNANYAPPVYQLLGKKIVSEKTFRQDNKDYTVTYIFTAKSK